MPINKRLLSKHPNKVFVETGTYDGATTSMAIGLGIFEKIISVEIDPGHYQRMVEKFKSYPQVTIIHGNTRLMFSEVLEKYVNKPATFWLDAHGNFFGYNPDGNVTPIIQELEAIKRQGIKGHTIIIDDIRILRRRDDWAVSVSEDDVLRALRNIDDFSFTYEDDDCAREDILVATPRGRH